MTNANPDTHTTLSSAQTAAIQQACSLIAPNWPLDRFIAVNALWEHRQKPIQLVSAQMAALGGASTTMSASYFLNAYQQGKISEASLIKAAQAYKSNTEIDELITALKQPSPGVWLSIAESADLNRDHHKMRWEDEIVHQISQFCGEFVNQDSAHDKTLYSSWLDFTEHDYGMSLLMGEKNLRHAFWQLPDNPEAVFLEAVEVLDLDPYELEIYAHTLLLSIIGWASYFAWQRWESRLENQDTQWMESLLAIRMAWDLVIWRQLKRKDSQEEFQALKTHWDQQKLAINDLIDDHIQQHRYFWIWMHAAELDFQNQLHEKLKAPPAALNSLPKMQAAFCIDVRSERYRRALEAQSPDIQTIGFAGFYGLPISYQPANTGVNRPQLPGLVAPTITVRESGSNKSQLKKIQNVSHWKNWSNSSVSAFTMVETVGWAYAFKLLKDNFLKKKKENVIDTFSHHHDWHLERDGVPLSLDEKATLASGVLKGIGLTDNFAPVVLLLGHGSETRNNLHASGLDCGACGGQTGEVNVRVLASLLNDPTLRQTLAESGIIIPEQTRFIGGLHNTTTDQVTCFEPLGDDTLEAALKQASNQTRHERALGIDSALASLDDKSLERALSIRAKDWSEVRPEWGLANNAAFIVAPRQWTRTVDLNGRAFLHDYDWRVDTEFVLLEQIMTAPMIVTHWINMQYNLSTADNKFFGSGNKLLHNAVGQHIGVFEGNGGDLRIGLPYQSVHDGENWRHEPLRLSVYIAAPKEAIERVIENHKTVRDLLHNNWLFLFSWSDNKTIELYQSEGWEKV